MKKIWPIYSSPSIVPPARGSKESLEPGSGWHWSVELHRLSPHPFEFKALSAKELSSFWNCPLRQ